MNLLSLTEDAESAVAAYRNPNISAWIDAIDPVLRVKIQQCEGWAVKIFRSECAAFPFEFRLKLPGAWRGLQAVRRNGWRHDSTGHRSIQGALTAAAGAAQWYRQRNPRNWDSPRRPI